MPVGDVMPGDDWLGDERGGGGCLVHALGYSMSGVGGGPLGSKEVDEMLDLPPSLSLHRTAPNRLFQPHPVTPRRDAHARSSQYRAQRSEQSISSSINVASSDADASACTSSAVDASEPELPKTVAEPSFVRLTGFVRAYPWTTVAGVGLGCALVLGMVRKSRLSFFPTTVQRFRRLPFYTPTPRPMVLKVPAFRVSGIGRQLWAGVTWSLKLGYVGLTLYSSIFVGTKVLRKLGWIQPASYLDSPASDYVDGSQRLDATEAGHAHDSTPSPSKLEQSQQRPPEQTAGVPDRAHCRTSGLSAQKRGSLSRIQVYGLLTAPTNAIYEIKTLHPFAELARKSNCTRHGLQANMTAVPPIAALGSWSLRLLDNFQSDPTAPGWRRCWIELTRKIDFGSDSRLTNTTAPGNNGLSILTLAPPGGLRFDSWIVNVPCLILVGEADSPIRVYVKLHQHIWSTHEDVNGAGDPSLLAVGEVMSQAELEIRVAFDAEAFLPAIATHADLCPALAAHRAEADDQPVPLDRYSPAEWARSVTVIKIGMPHRDDVQPHKVMHGGWVIEFLNRVPVPADVDAQGRGKMLVRLIEHDAGYERAANDLQLELGEPVQRPRRVIYQGTTHVRFDDAGEPEAVDIGPYTFTWGETSSGKTLLPGVPSGLVA